MAKKEDILLWIQVRLCVGLNVTDRAANEFFKAHGAEEAEYWEGQLGDDAAAGVTIYFADEGDNVEGDMSLRRFTGDKPYAMSEATYPVHYMVFYPTLAQPTTGTVPDPDPPTAVLTTQQQLDARFQWSVLSSRVPPLSKTSAKKVFEMPVEERSSHSVTINGWSVELGLVLAKEGTRVMDDTSLGELQYWQERHVVLQEYFARLRNPEVKAVLASMEQTPHSRWPILHAQLLCAHTEAVRKVSDCYLTAKPLTTVSNTLPAKSGIGPLFDAAYHFHISLCLMAVCAREPFELADLERIYTKVNTEVTARIVEYIDVASLFALSEEELSLVPSEAPNVQVTDSISLHTTQTVMPSSVEKGKARLAKASQLLVEWRRVYTQCSVWMAGCKCWPRDTRRLFLSFEVALERCQHLVQILDDLIDEQPDIAEDRGGHRRYRALVEVLQKFEFDIFDVGHLANWRIFIKHWSESVADKISHPATPLVSTPPLARVTTEPINERLPVSNVLRNFSPTQDVTKDSFKVDTSDMSDFERITLLSQEKQILAEKLAEANGLLAEDRQAITALTREYDKSLELIAFLREQLKTTNGAAKAAAAEQVHPPPAAPLPHPVASCV